MLAFGREMTSVESELEGVQTLADVRLRGALEACSAPSVRVVSTDIFDTLLWRSVPAPVDAFSILAERHRSNGTLAPALTLDGFRRIRRTAESQARKQRMGGYGQTEVTLAEIYALIPAWVFAGKLGPQEAAALELGVESDLLFPDLDVVSVLRGARTAGKLIICVSDSYLSSAEVRSLLLQPGSAMLEFDHVFTSSDHRVSKGEGLFEIVVRTLGIEPEELVHIGDNADADVEAPGELGSRGEYVARRPGELAKIFASEERLMRLPPDAPAHLRASGSINAMRVKAVSRPAQEVLPGGLREYWRYGASVLGPVFTGFAEWVHARCAESGSKQVLCLMREGTFLGELIEGANAYLETELTAVPLWVNRKLALRASLVNVDHDSLQGLLSRRSPQTVSAFLRALGLDPADVPTFAAQLDSTLVDPPLLLSLIEHLEENASLRNRILTESRRLREAIATLIESHAPGGGPITVVDLGWGATIQGNVMKALGESGLHRHIAGLYLVTGANAASQMIEGAEVHGFLADFGEPDDFVQPLLRSPEILEQVCMPPHGSQLDIDRDLSPVLGPAAASSLQQVEAEAVRAGILAFQREWASQQTLMPGKLCEISKAQHMLRAITLRSVVSPTAAEAEIFGRWRHDESENADETDLLADPKMVPRLRHLAPAQIDQLPMSELYWPYGLAAQIDETWPALVDAAVAGLIPWESMGSELETGTFSIEASGGVGIEDVETQVVPTRNRFGLSYVRASLTAPRITELTIRPARRPGILRLDWIELACHAQGHSVPLRVRLDAAGGLDRLRRGTDTYLIGSNLVLIHGGSPSFSFDLAPTTPRVISRVDVEVAFAMLPIGGLLPFEGRFVDMDAAARALAEARSGIADRAVAHARRYAHDVYRSLRRS